MKPLPYKNPITRNELTKPEWEMQDFEGIQDFEYFKHYLQQGIGRTLKNVALAFTNTAEDAEALYGHLKSKSARKDWTTRIRFYDEHLSKLELKRYDEMRIKRLDKALKLSETASDIVSSVLSEYIKDRLNHKEVYQELSPKDKLDVVFKAIKSHSDISKLVQSLLGEPTEIHQVTNQQNNVNININYDNLEHDELIKKAKEFGFQRSIIDNRGSEALASVN